MLPSATQTQGTFGRIQGCLDADVVTTKGTPEDLIGLSESNLVGFDIWNTNQAVVCRLERQDLNQDTIESWITESPGSVRDGATLCGKILVGEQAVGNDELRPPPEAAAIRFSRYELCSRFGFAPRAVSWASGRKSWSLNFTGRTSSSYCAGLGTAYFSVVQSVRESIAPCNKSCTLLVFHRPVQVAALDRFLAELSKLHHLANDPALITYLVARAADSIHSRLIDSSFEEISVAERQIAQYHPQSDLHTVFGGSHTRARAVGYVEVDARNVLRLVETCAAGLKDQLKASNGVALAQVSKVQEELLTGLDYCAQTLQVTISSTHFFQDYSAKQLTTALSVISHEQQQTSIGLSKANAELARLAREDQKISIEIAEASKAIAEDTKKDGYSMKTLAVVTMCFLPATSVSSILAMPLFDWTATRSSVVHPRIWVYFLLTTLLTAVTLISWWLWQRSVVRKAHGFSFSRRSKHSA